MKNIKTALILALLLAGGASAFAASHVGAPMAGAAKKEMPMAMSGNMTEGEVRKVDMAAKKVTIKHGEIKNMDMPPMTMVFQVKDAAVLEKVKVGDKVLFTVEKSGGAMVVTDMQPAK
jgi:Cu(I)/Ag(I) efflux system periplasmic protein CusF